MVRALLLTVSLVAACYSPPEPDCGFFCGAGDACPADYHCARDHRCHRDGTPEALSCGVDAAIDTRPPQQDAAPDAPDFAAPYVISATPLGSNVDVTTPIIVQFNEYVQNVDNTTFVASSSTVSSYPGSISIAFRQPAYYFYPTTSWPNATDITVTLSGTISDLAGNPMGSDYVFSFTTAP